MSSKAVQRHAKVGAGAIVLVAVLMYITEFSTEDWSIAMSPKTAGSLWQFNVATGSVALVALAAVMAIRPVRTMRGRTTPVHLPIRRVLGLWVAVLAVAHIPGGLALHTTGIRIWTPFVAILPGVGGPTDAYTVGFWSGLAATLLLVPLVATSTSAAIRRLGAPQWRRWHRRLVWGTYWTLALHVVALQYAESRDVRHVALTASVFAIALGARLVAAGLDRWHGTRAVPSPA